MVLLFIVPVFHRDGFNLIPYPFELLDRLLGLSSSAIVFSNEIAENRSPITLLMNGENVLQSVLMLGLCVNGIILAVVRWYLQPAPYMSWQFSWQAKERIEAEVTGGKLPPTQAAKEIIDVMERELFHGGK